MRYKISVFIIGFMLSFSVLFIFNGVSHLEYKTLPISDLIEDAYSFVEVRIQENQKITDTGGGLESCGVSLQAPTEICSTRTPLAVAKIDPNEFQKRNNSCEFLKWETNDKIKVSDSDNINFTDTVRQPLRENGRLRNQRVVLFKPVDGVGNAKLTVKLLNKSGEPCNCGSEESRNIKIFKFELTKELPRGDKFEQVCPGTPVILRASLDGPDSESSSKTIRFSCQGSPTGKNVNTDGNGLAETSVRFDNTGTFSCKALVRDKNICTRRVSVKVGVNTINPGCGIATGSAAAAVGASVVKCTSIVPSIGTSAPACAAAITTATILVTNATQECLDCDPRLKSIKQRLKNIKNAIETISGFF